MYEDWGDGGTLTDLVHHADYKALLLDVVLLDCVFIFQNLACHGVLADSLFPK